MFSITLANIDSYQASPIPELDVTFSEFRGSEVKKVPVIRIFGSTATGKKTCLHIHGVFPYMYVPYTGQENSVKFAYQLASSIDSALNTSFGSTLSTNQHVYKIQKVSGIPFYGYHSKEHLFFKIYFYNPAIIRRTAELMQNGAVLSQQLQPYEAHIPYILQFMIDYNLYGMNLINLNTVKYRQERIMVDNQNRILTDSLISQVYLPASVTRQSMCELEVDGQAFDILNNQYISEKMELNPGLAAIWEEEKVRRAGIGLENAKSQLLYSRDSNKVVLPPTSNDIFQEAQLLKRLNTISQSDESVVSNTNMLSYPIEVEDDEHVLNASHVLNHSMHLASSENIERGISDDNKLSQLVSSVEVDQSLNRTADSILDTDDIQLVEMLADLAEKNKEASNVDDDSVLGSQYSIFSEPAKDDPEEEEEVEDLNITSLDLSSWESMLKRSANQRDDVVEVICDETNRESPDNLHNIEENCDDITFVSLPQLDGADDLYWNASKHGNEIVSRSKNTTDYTAIQHTLRKVPFNTAKVNTCNQYRNLRLVDIVEYFINNISGCYSREKLFNFINECYFQIFVKTGKNFQATSATSLNVNADVVVGKMRNNERKIIYNGEKVKESLIIWYHLQPDHRDLDVYDVDEITSHKNLKDADPCDTSSDEEKHSCEENSLHSQQLSCCSNNCSTRCDPPNFLMKFAIANVDGAIVSDSSDSEAEVDVTIDKHEERICVYKNRNKNLPATPKKRPLDTDDDESPTKRRNTGVRTPKRKIYGSPSKISRSPQCLSKNYTPLDIIITSPKTNSPIRQCESPKKKQHVQVSDQIPSTSASTTPRRMRHELRVNLLRERRVANLLSSNLGATEAMIVHKQVEERRTENSEDSLTKISAEEVRKRLQFSTDHSEVENTFAESDRRLIQAKDLIGVGHLADRTDEDVAVSSSGNENTEDILPNSQRSGKSSSDVSPERDYATGVHSLINKFKKFHDDVIPETDLEEDEEDACNTTFTQHVNQRMGSDSLNFPSQRSGQSSENTLIVITTKYKPPSAERITESITMYGISKCKATKPFFSNKEDLTKHIESAGVNALRFDVLGFKSSLEEVTSIKLWRRMKVNEFYPSGSSIKTSRLKRALAGYNSLTIKPLVVPPSPRDVQNWIRAKKYLSGEDRNVKSRKQQKEEKKSSGTPDAHKSLPINILKDESRPKVDHSTSNTLNSEKFVPSEPNVLSGPIVENKTRLGTQNFNSSQRSQAFRNVLNPSLRKALENPLLYKQNETLQSRYSYGQIEYSSKESSGNVSNENLQNVRAVTTHQHLTLLSLEVHVVTRNDLLPDPQHDPIAALFYAIHCDASEQIEHGVIVVNCSSVSSRLNQIHSASVMCSISYVATERDMLNGLVELIERHNPDILVGWEIEALSWGYVFQRALKLALTGFPLKISKIPYAPAFSKYDVHVDDVSDIKVPGRNILDVWRIMRHEAALLTYTFENVMHHVLHERIPCPSFKTLTTWWRHENMIMRRRVIQHYVIRVRGTLKILNHLDIIGRTCEHARLFGIQFYEVFSRGSQFRVESMMLRLAKPMNYIAISPSIHQKAKMRAPECIPLIMEPESKFYTDPLVVLDFQSLYPSMIIAYNYCFSTCLGRIEHIGQCWPFSFGAATLRVKKSTAVRLRDKMNFSPCGVAFVKKEVREGILPRMLTEILNTRLMVKESMKLHPAENRTLQRVLHSQQLGLKLIANVTYGYTSANFSGRMPCIEIGDSVVSKGRETLERAIKLVEATPRWGARVVYGDTDSMFVLLPGRSREEAFVIGEEIADAVTATNPLPVKLKFEKVLQPAILQTKKRYCGYMYETRDQKTPEFLAKGIETVRRDGCPAVAKILEKSLKILFDTKDVSQVKSYVIRQFDKIFRRRVSVQDLTFAKEFRGIRGYKANACVPALELTRRLIKKDPRAVPRTSERVRYIIVAGAPNQTLIHCVRTPMEVILDLALIPNAVYYITKVITPPLNRCFNLFGIDVNEWYKEMSHRQSFDNDVRLNGDNPKATIRQFFSSSACLTCGQQTNKEVCGECQSQPSRTVLVLLEKICQLERNYQQIAAICHSCIGRPGDIECVSLDCPVLYRLIQARKELAQVPFINSIIYKSNSSGIKEISAVADWY